MPKMTKDGRLIRDQLPRTFQRSSAKERRTFAETYERGGRTAGGVDVLGHTRDELLERATRLGITGRHRMAKEDLGRAIARKEGSRATARLDLLTGGMDWGRWGVP